MRCLLLAALLLSGCGWQEAHEARTQLLGRNIAAVTQCASLPDSTQMLDDHTAIREWSYHDSAPALSVALAFVGSVSVGGGAACKMDLSFRRDGIITAVNFPGCTSTLLRGPYAAAGNIVGECLGYPGNAVPGAGWDAFSGLSVGAKAGGKP